MRTAIWKRLISGVLASLMAMSVALTAVGCAKTDETVNSDTVGTTGTNAAQTETETVAAYDELKKEQFNREFVICTRDEEDVKWEFMAEKLTGVLLNDHIYERNDRVSHDYGVEIKVNPIPSTKGVDQELKLQVKSNLDDYDAFVGHKTTYSACGVTNHLLNLNNIDTLDLTKPYWDQAFLENMSADGKTYVAIGDLNTQSMCFSSCLIFNKEMMADNQKNVADLYKSVNDGKWTMDSFYEYIKDMNMDLDGDMKMTPDKDRYGLTSWMMDVPYSLFYGADGRYITLDEENIPVASYDNAKITDIYDKIYNIIKGTEAYMATTEQDYFDHTYQVFTEGRALFCDITLNKITQFIVGTPVSYGIVPMPKFDETQKEYLSFVNGATTMMMIAKSEKDPEFVGTILQAMSAYNYDHVTPDLFQVVTKLQSAQDPESSAMVDYILRNRIFDYAYMASFGIGEMVREEIVKGNDSIASAMKKYQKMLSTDLKKTLHYLDKCD